MFDINMFGFQMLLNKVNNNLIQSFIYLRVYSVAQRAIIKSARAKRQTKQIHTHKQKTKQGYMYHLDNNNSIIRSRYNNDDVRKKTSILNTVTKYDRDKPFCFQMHQHPYKERSS
jgi:hypothetical protein